MIEEQLFDQISFLLQILPTGFVIGIVERRIASLNLIPFLLPAKIYNTTIKCIFTGLVWRYLLCTNFGMDCILPPLNLFSNTSSNDQEDVKGVEGLNGICNVQDGIQVTVLLVLRTLLFCFAARFGSAHQPVGLTGGIACGKSTVAQLLSNEEGNNDGTKSKKVPFTFIDLDKIGHDILVEPTDKDNMDESAYPQIIQEFEGEDIFVSPSSSKNNNKKKSNKSPSTLPPQLEIDRRKLGDIIFRDESKRKILNGITHPLISKLMMKNVVSKSLKSKNSIVAVDVPLLFEVGLKLKAIFSIKIVVACSPQVQLERLVNRNKDLTKEQCENRIESQMPVVDKVKMADVVIWNNGSMEDLKVEVEKARIDVVDRVQGLIRMSFAQFVLTIGFVTTILCVSTILEQM